MQQVIADLGRVGIGEFKVGLRIYGYGLMMVLGFISGILLARWRARRAGEDPNVVPTLGLLALAGGVIGSRLAYVIEKWHSQFAWRPDPLPEILNITSGGLIYYGGVALATAAILSYLWLRRLPIRRYLDIITPSLMIGLAFGRAGCLLNGCCYGGPCRADFRLGMTFPYASKPLLKLSRQGNLFGAASVSPVFAHQAALPNGQGGMDHRRLPDWLWRRDPLGQIEHYANGTPMLKSPDELTDEQAREALRLRSLPVQPAQVYGIVNALLIAGILLCFSRLREREGVVFCLMLILYSITRFVLESIRGDNPHSLFSLKLTHNQYTSVGAVALGVVIWVLLRRLPASAGPSGRERLALQAQAATARKRKGKER
jgi:phosphatidylglycerol:prolipoprotein diacylglycerol transferase